MAAVMSAQISDILPLDQIRPAQIEALIEEEIRVWRQHLDWDFRPSAALVRRFVDAQALNGFALVAGDRKPVTDGTCPSQTCGRPEFGWPGLIHRSVPARLT
jgi:hypothetical protein